MTTIPPNAQQVLDDNEEALSNIVNNSLGPMPDGLTIEQQEEFRARELAQMQLGKNNFNALIDANKQMQDAAQKAVSAIPNDVLNRASSLFFDLLKEAQANMSMVDPMMDSFSDQSSDPMENSVLQDPSYATFDDIKSWETVSKFDSQIDLFNYLEENLGTGDPKAIDKVRNELFSMVGNKPTIDEQGIKQPNPQQVIADSLQDYLIAMQEQNEQKRAELSMTMFKAMPQSDQGDTMVQGVEKVVAESNEAIRRLANSLAQHQMNKSSSVKPFNLKKEAQHKTMENIVMHGPGGNRIDPFTGQLINDWHIYERNKGWGLKMDDALFVDYEAIWRGNIMDKYSRPYRDKDGNYVGGYIEKRFETDKWIPPANNYQLKPGERRRPYLPEYGLTEARMQHMRSTNKDEGKVFNDTSKPFNWSKMAKSKNNIKISQLVEEKEDQLTFIVQDLESGKTFDRVSARTKDEALQEAQAIARKISKPVSLLTYNLSVDDIEPIEEDMVWPDQGPQSIAASSNSKKKVN